MILSRPALADLAGRTRPSAIKRWLDSRGVPYLVDADGWPRVREDVLFPPSPKISEPTPPPRPLLPNLDEDEVYFSLDEIRQRAERYSIALQTIHCGVYFLFRGDELLYIGRSIYVPSRLRAHFMKRVDDRRNAIWFDHVATVRVPEVWLATVENAYIRTEKPPRNVKNLTRFSMYG